MAKITGLGGVFYVVKDPVNGVDPSGLWTCGATEKQCDSIEKGIAKIGEAAGNLKEGSAEHSWIGQLTAVALRRFSIIKKRTM